MVGAQKVVPDLETALGRIRTYCLPKESERQQAKVGMDSIIGKILIIEREAFPNRSAVVLIREVIGF